MTPIHPPNFFTRILGLGPRRHPVLRHDPVFIIGMHRSGTSALGGALAAFGLSLGKTVMAPNPDKGNPKGFYENLAIVNLHDQFLAEIGWEWLKPIPIPSLHFHGPVARRFQGEILRVMVEEFGSSRPLIKDPRLCELLPLWRPLLKKYFAEAAFVTPVRSPMEVASSLAKRDHFSLGHGLILWAIHVLEAERGSRGFRRLFTTYEKLLAHPVDVMAGLARELNLPDDGAPSAVAEQIDPALRHHAEVPWPPDQPHRDLILSIYETLVRNGPKLERILNQLRRDYYRAMGFQR